MSCKVPVVLEQVKQNPDVNALIHAADEHLGALGFTEHGHRHANLVASIAGNVLTRLAFSQREAELAAIAGYLHDIGNAVSREDHGRSGAILAGNILAGMGMETPEIASIMGAIGNHEDEMGVAVNHVGAALILADKSDVHRSRVRNTDVATFDIHDRVNYAVVRSFLHVDGSRRTVTLELNIAVDIVPVMEYFEIFLQRMVMCRRAAGFLNAPFGLIANGAKLL